MNNMKFKALFHDILNNEPIYIDNLNARSEYEVKKKIVSELEQLKDDRAGSTNTISIDYAIKIVNKA